MHEYVCEMTLVAIFGSRETRGESASLTFTPSFQSLLMVFARQKKRDSARLFSLFVLVPATLRNPFFALSFTLS